VRPKVEARPLSALPALVVLGLAQNRIEDPSPLRALTSLNSLDLSGNQLQRLNPSFRVPSLTILNLSSNGLSQLPAISRLSFQNLDLAHNPAYRSERAHRRHLQRYAVHPLRNHTRLARSAR
jgi:Leucine-rich repeat (LRR) protein